MKIIQIIMLMALLVGSGFSDEYVPEGLRDVLEGNLFVQASVKRFHKNFSYDLNEKVVDHLTLKITNFRNNNEEDIPRLFVKYLKDFRKKAKTELDIDTIQFDQKSKFLEDSIGLFGSQLFQKIHVEGNLKLEFHNKANPGEHFRSKFYMTKFSTKNASYSRDTKTNQWVQTK
ncbi:MAG: hypothetical protein KC646_12505 [Candidatus Cloacimonetes bacterium]|nr:hypothetical protein [Candidatus Cloacimonadota bacterium]